MCTERLSCTCPKLISARSDDAALIERAIENVSVSLDRATTSIAPSNTHTERALEPQVRHHENDGKLEQPLDACQPGILHSQLHDLIDVWCRRNKLLKDTNLVRQQKTKALNDKHDGDDYRLNDPGAVKVPHSELLG